MDCIEAQTPMVPQNLITKMEMISSVSFALVRVCLFGYNTKLYTISLTLYTEFLQDPASCGKCSSRFCFTCIQRVAQQSKTPAKCPTCRCEFQLADITRDTALAERMQRANTVSCQYQGCHAQLSLTQVAAHEQSCVFVPIKCRYASFGCEWKGIRQTLAQHEVSCPLMQVSQLVQQFRQLRANHEYTLYQLQSRVCIHSYCRKCLFWCILRKLTRHLFVLL